MNRFAGRHVPFLARSISLIIQWTNSIVSFELSAVSPFFSRLSYTIAWYSHKVLLMGVHSGLVYPLLGKHYDCRCTHEGSIDRQMVRWSADSKEQRDWTTWIRVNLRFKITIKGVIEIQNREDSAELLRWNLPIRHHGKIVQNRWSSE